MNGSHSASPSLQQLALAVQAAQDEIQAACVMLWLTVTSIEPRLLEVQRALGWSDHEAAHWVEGAMQTYDPAVDWPRQAQSWLGQLRRITQEFAR